MSGIFNTFLYQPILSVLFFIYENLAFSDLGVAIIMLTIFVRIVLFPIFYKGAKDQSLMARLQPHIKKIQLDHKDDKEKQAKMLMALYREHKLNPFSGFLLLLLQLPVFIVLFQIFTRELATSTFDSHMFLSLINLEEKSVAMALIAAAFQYIQGKMTVVPGKGGGKEQDQLASMSKVMIFMGPLFTLLILTRLPAALGLYWITSTLFSIAQQAYINKKISSSQKFREPKSNHE